MTPQPMGTEPTVIVQTERGPVGVDASVAPIVTALNAAGVPTIASCSGHGHRPANIALRDGRELIIARSYDEARAIDSLFPVGANGDHLPPSALSLRSTRRWAGLKAIELAAALDISPEHLSRMERGHRAVSRAMMLAVRSVCGDARRDRDAALRKAGGFEAVGQQPGPERSEGIAQ